MKKNNQSKQVLLFDLDGTLLDSRGFLLKTSFDMLEKHFSGQYSYGQVVEGFGDGFNRYLPEDLPSQSKIAINEFNSIKHEYYHQNALPFPGVLEGLQALKNQGYELGIVTNQLRLISINAMQE